ncbi:hypothetical protein JCM10908_006691 [Rhodotorula pacifica]|uniref:uncharacterized protein n=1 Tax=Rhodotorula pacifica TaxID=1495444 RepID=UPI00316D8332
MDIQALRARALETKKRKRLRPENTTTPVLRLDVDLEEGEIDDVASPMQPTPSPVPDRHAQAVADVSSTRAASAAGPAPVDEYASGPSAVPSTSRGAFNPTSIPTGVKDESKRVIAELLSYGVPPAYLLSIGVSHLLLSTSFRELRLGIALPPASDVTPPLEPLARASQGLAAPAAGVDTSRATAAGHDFAALEAQKREELLARKAALLARNQQHALSLESELDSLFSATLAPQDSDDSSPPTYVSTIAADDADATALAKRKKRQQQKWARKKRRLEATAEAFTPASARTEDTPVSLVSAQAVHDLRESLDHTEEVVSVPQGGPFATDGTLRHASLAASSSQPATRHSAPGQPRSRPIATEFEHDPTVRLSSNSLMRGRNGRAFIADVPVRMVIDISDNDDGESDEDDQRNAERASGAVEAGLHPTLPSRNPAATDADPSTAASQLAVLSPRSAATAEDTSPEEMERRRQLQEKEMAIKAMMERIAEIERRKKDMAKGRTPEHTPMTRSVSEGIATAETTGRTGAHVMTERGSVLDEWGSGSILPQVRSRNSESYFGFQTEPALQEPSTKRSTPAEVEAASRASPDTLA